MSYEIRVLLKPPTSDFKYLTIEFERNKMPWGIDLEVGNPHFSFGRDKAKIVLEFWDLIEEYVKSNGSMPEIFNSQCRIIDGTNWGGYVTVVKEPEFYRDQYLIEKHYLKFSYNETTWGFGLTKAKAVVLFKEQIQFVADNG